MAQASSRRDDIQGVRAIGIALIVVFHVWIGRVSGGVDVLFVISGYLMTQSLLRAEGPALAAALAFWSRTALRILPAAFLIVALVVLWASTFGPPQELLGLHGHALASLFQVENLYLKVVAADYLARDEPPSPLQHFWALSLQMQVFAVLPLLVLAIRLLDARFGGRAALALPLGLAVLSFAYALQAIEIYAPGAYFDPRARAWEFLAGVVLALLPAARIPDATRVAMSWAGLALIVACGFVVPVHWAFPGPVALMPVAGAALVLLSGAGRFAPWAANGLLAVRPLASVGQYAFTIYLWHWPILVYAMHALGATTLGLLPGIAVLAASVALAWATHRTFEMPVRERSRRWLAALAARGGVWPAAPAAASVLVAALIAAPVLLRDGQVRAQVGNYLRYVDGGAHAEDYFGGEPWVPELELQLQAARGLNPAAYADGCHVGLREAEVRVCEYGDPAGTYTVAIVGGSHAAQWLPALELVAERQGIRLLALTKSACLLGGGGEGDAASCRAWNDALLAELARRRPDAVFTSTLALWETPDVLPDAYTALWRRLNGMGIDVVAVRDNPRPREDAPSCVARAMRWPAACAEARAAVLSARDPAAGPFGRGIYTFDLTDAYCDAEACPYVRDGRLVYRDRSHLAVPFVRELAPRVETELLAARRHFGEMDLASRAPKPRPQARPAAFR